MSIKMNQNMKFINLIILSLLLFISSSALAQHARFVESGKITFEKRTNVHALLKRSYSNVKDAISIQIYEQTVKTTPQFRTQIFHLHFGSNKSLFSFEKDATPPSNTNSFMSLTQTDLQDKITYFDFNDNLQISQRKFYENQYVLHDAPIAIDWKITEETREIAGYMCRRANAIVFDSVYIVAFYTDQIMVSGGPEIYSGLPGMILGLAMPHEHVTWFATAVEDRQVSANELTVPKKGKKLNVEELTEDLKKIMGRNVTEQNIRNFLKQIRM
jgi:GLPGLI family protein